MKQEVCKRDYYTSESKGTSVDYRDRIQAIQQEASIMSEDYKAVKLVSNC